MAAAAGTEPQAQIVGLVEVDAFDLTSLSILSDENLICRASVIISSLCKTAFEMKDSESGATALSTAVALIRKLRAARSVASQVHAIEECLSTGSSFLQVLCKQARVLKADDGGTWNSVYNEKVVQFWAAVFPCCKDLQAFDAKAAESCLHFFLALLQSGLDDSADRAAKALAETGCVTVEAPRAESFIAPGQLIRKTRLCFERRSSF